MRKAIEGTAVVPQSSGTLQVSSSTGLPATPGSVGVTMNAVSVRTATQPPGCATAAPRLAFQGLLDGVATMP